MTVGPITPLCAGCAYRRDPWGLTFSAMMDMAGDSDLFLAAPELERQGAVLGADGRYRVPEHPDELWAEVRPGQWERATDIIRVRGVGSIRMRLNPGGGIDLDVRDLRGEPAPQLAPAVKAALETWERDQVRAAHQDGVTALPLFGDVA